jgi:hypothetical protein
MIELGILFGLFLVTALALIFVLLRRQNGKTENADGLLIACTADTGAERSSDLRTWGMERPLANRARSLPPLILAGQDVGDGA